MVRAFWLASFTGLLTRRTRRDGAANRQQTASHRIRPQERLEDRRVMAVDVLPDVVVDVMATASDASVALTWTAPADNGAVIADYLAEYSTDEGLNWQPYDDGVSADPLMTVSGLANGTSYVFQIAAVNEFQQPGVWSLGSNAVTPAGLPGTPTDVTASWGDGFVDLVWNAPLTDNGSAVTGYVVEYSSDGENWLSVPESVVDSSFSVTGLANGTSYVFHVAALNGVGQGDFSAATDAVTPAGLPGVPVDVIASRGDGAIDVTWNIPLSDGGSAVTGYLVDYSLDDGATWIEAVGQESQSTATAVNVPDLTNGIAYVFRVAAMNTIGQSEYSAWSTAVTPAGLPGAPLEVVTSRGDGSVDLTWTAPDGNGSDVVDYAVEYSIDDGLSWTLFDDGVSTEAVVSVNGLSPAASYIFHVSALNDVGQGEWSGPTAATSPLRAPGQATSPAIVGGNRTARLTWEAPLDDGGSPIIAYIVEYRPAGGSAWTSLPAESVSGNSATVTGLTNGVTYQFRVAVQTTFATGDYTDGTLSATPLPPPTRLQGRASAGTSPVGSVTLSWVAPATPANVTVLDYVIESSANGGVTWAVQNDVVSRATSSVVGGLVNGTTYLFRVAAVTAGGQGEFSAPSIGLTPFLRTVAAAPAAPTGLTGVGGRGLVTLSWVAPPRNSGGPPVDYVVRFRLDAPGTRWFTYPRGASADPMSVLRRLSPGQSFVFQVAARNLRGIGAFSAPVSVRA